VTRRDWNALLDAVEFEEELEQFEAVEEGPRLTIDELDQGLGVEAPNSVEHYEWPEEPEVPADIPAETPEEPARQSTAWMAAAFFALMAVGAAAAALVFHERVATIIASIR
jgi:hypothetical protein